MNTKVEYVVMLLACIVGGAAIAMMIKESMLLCIGICVACVIIMYILEHGTILNLFAAIEHRLIAYRNRQREPRF